jgi:hypothetical protein
MSVLGYALDVRADFLIKLLKKKQFSKIIFIIKIHERIIKNNCNYKKLINVIHKLGTFFFL